MKDCQTCFMCEAYCPVDAMYVSPLADRLEGVEEGRLIETGTLGSWRAEIGWGPKGKGSMAARDTVPLLNGLRDRRRAAVVERVAASADADSNEAAPSQRQEGGS